MATIQPVVGPDFGRLIQQGIQTFGAVQGLQQRQRQADRREEIEELTRGIGADPTKLAQLRVLDPKRALAIQQGFDITQRQKREEEERFRRERPLIASQIKGQPQSEQVRILTAQIERVNQRGGDPSNTQGLLDLIQGTPEENQQAEGFIDVAIDQGVRENFLKAPVVAKPEARTALARNLELAGIDPLSKLGRDLITRNLAGSSQSFTVSPDGTVTFQSGKGITPAGLQKPTARLLEKKLVFFEETIGDLARIREQFEPDFLTFAGKGRAFLTSLKSKGGLNLTSEEIEFTQKRRRFTQNVNRTFNAYRKEITGAAAAVRELEDIKKAALNVDLSPVEFTAALDELESEMKRGRRLIRKLLREGVTGNLKDKRSEVSKRFDQEFTAGSDDAPLDRLEDLRLSGVSKDKMLEILEAEGYTF